MFVFRYRKVCCPLKRQITSGFAKGLCYLCLLIALCLSWPAPILYGREEIPTSNPNITGIKCGLEETFKDAGYMTYFNFVLILIYTVAFLVLVVLYTAMWKVIRSHLSLRYQASVIDFQKVNTPDQSSSLTISFSEVSATGGVPQPAIVNGERINAPNVSAAIQNHQKQKKGKSHRATLVFLVITVIYFLSYVPHLTLQILTFSIPDFVSSLSFWGKVFYHTFLWCFFFNNVINAIVYFVCDSQFRSALKSLYRPTCVRRETNLQNSYH